MARTNNNLARTNNNNNMDHNHNNHYNSRTNNNNNMDNNNDSMDYNTTTYNSLAGNNNQKMARPWWAPAGKRRRKVALKNNLEKADHPPCPLLPIGQNKLLAEEDDLIS